MSPGCGSSGCWTNQIRLVDVNSDGLLDVIAANHPSFFADISTTEPLQIHISQPGRSLVESSLALVDDWHAALRQVGFGDVDLDGRTDFYAPQAVDLPAALYIQQADGSFTDQAESRLPEESPRASATRVGDLDADGDLDLVVTDGFAASGPPFAHVYRNEAGVFTEIAGAVPSDVLSAGERVIPDIALFDADGDLDLDLLIAPRSVGAAILFNDGSGTFESTRLLPAPASSASSYHVGVCDVDGDGDVDVWRSNTAASFAEQLLINDGSGGFTDETALRVSGNPGEDDSGVLCADVDSDGDHDAIVYSVSSPERLLRNDGDGNFAFVADAFPGETDCTASAQMGDIDGDGRLDLVTGQAECADRRNQVYFGNDRMAVDERAPRIVRIESLDELEPGSAPTVRFAVDDDVVSPDGPRIAGARAVVDPDGSADTLAAFAMGGGLFRVVLPPLDETTPFQLCATDPAGNEGCSETQTAEVAATTPDAGVSPDVDAGDRDAATVPDGGSDLDGGIDMIDGGPDPDDGGGCSCSHTGAGGGPADALLPLLALWWFRRRR